MENESLRLLTIVVQRKLGDRTLDAVLAAVTQAAELDKPGQGFAYVQEVIKAVGFSPAPSGDGKP
jgi:nitrogen regulatory protein PII